jgi:hypothetical protein
VVWCHCVNLVRQPLTGLLYQPRTIDDECGAVGGMRIGRGNLSTRRKHSPVPLSPPQIPHDVTWARIWATAVRSRRLTPWARPKLSLSYSASPSLHPSLSHCSCNSWSTPSCCTRHAQPRGQVKITACIMSFLSHLILFNMMTLILPDEEWRLWGCH